MERKERYLEALQKAEDDAVLIAAADKIDNIESKLEAYEREGEELLARWKRPMSDYLWYHGEALRIVQARIPDNPLAQRLAEVHAREKKVFA